MQPEPMGLLWNWGLGAINGGIGHIKREVQVTNLNPPEIHLFRSCHDLQVVDMIMHEYGL